MFIQTVASRFRPDDESEADRKERAGSAVWIVTLPFTNTNSPREHDASLKPQRDTGTPEDVNIEPESDCV